jgi:hypothetical protein
LKLKYFMKRKTLILLFVAGLSLLPADLRSQDQPESPATAEKRAAAAAARQNDISRRADEAAAREAEAQQNFYAQVQHNNDLVAKQQAQAEGEYKRANAMYQDRLRGVIQRAPGSPGRSLVIRSSELDPKEQANLEEDLPVMSHLLEKMVGSSLGPQPQSSPVLGVNVVFAPGSSPTRGLYLEGYGAIFTLSVGFPLLPSAKESDERENPSADSTWNEARQEVFGQRMDGRGSYGRGEEYDERKVNTLKDSVLEALKNATHIRGLKADDSIMVCVFGGGAALPIKAVTSNKPGAQNPKEVMRYVPDRPQPRTTMLTIRVKKSDVDSFAKDKLNLDDLRKRAKIMPYAGGPDSAMGGGFVGGGGGSFGGGNFGGGNTFGGGGSY